MIRCPTCATENPADNKFCRECGSALAGTCASCGTANPPDHKFCRECGKPLSTTTAQPATASPSRAGRRLVSVLFADLVGFTTFSEGRDPEDVRTMLTGYFDRAREIVNRFGGSVDKFIGDAVMAVWGATEAHEDDAERAVRAALELVDAVTSWGAEIGSPELRLRAGVNTGEASVGPGGNDKGLVVGDLVNTASRLQSFAEPGTVVVGETTRDLVADAVLFEPLGDQKVKGKQQPVAAYRALRVIAERGGRNRSDTVEPPFVGRDDELRLLKDQVHATGREGRARMVSVIGEAGIGKSRLGWELLKYIDGITENVYWHHGRSPSYGDGLTFWALGEMVRSRAGIAETDDPAKSRMKLRTAVAEYVPVEDDRRWIEPRLAGLLGLDAMPTGERTEVFAALRTFFQCIAEQGTTLLVFEDLHWADDGLIDFIQELVERSPRHPILVITLARPDLLETRAGWGSGRRSAMSLHLAPLSDGAMTAMVSGMVPGMPPEAVASIVARAGGIPLYAVEFIRMLIGRGELIRVDGGVRIEGSLADLSIPESLQAVIGSRLDRLSAAERDTIQDAALLGQAFTAVGLAAVRGGTATDLLPVLDELVIHELLELDDDPRSPERGQYRFVQSLIREVAYGRLGKEERRSRHLAAAAYFEGLGEVELAGAVAGHYLEAYRADPAGSPGLIESARSALVDAARRAVGLSSHGQALTLLRQSLEFTVEPGERGPLLEQAASAAAWGARVHEAADLAADAVATYASLDDEPGRLRATTLQAFVLAGVFQADEAVALLRPVYESLGLLDSTEKVRLALEMGRALMLSRRFEESLDVLDRALAVAEQFVDREGVLMGIISRASTLTYAGRSVESHTALKGAAAVAEELGLQALQIRALNNLSVEQALESPRNAAATADILEPLVERFGALAWVHRTAATFIPDRINEGRFDDAARLINSVDPEDLSDVYRRSLEYGRAYLAAITTNDRDALATMERVSIDLAASTDLQLREAGEMQLAESMESAGRFKEAFAVVANSGDPLSAMAVTRLAVLAADRGLIEHAQARIDQLLPRGRLRTASTELLAAAGDALDGAPRAAWSAQRAIDQYAEVALPMDIAKTNAAFSKLLGHDTEAGQAAGERARAWIESVGAPLLLETLNKHLPVRQQSKAAAS